MAENILFKETLNEERYQHVQINTDKNSKIRKGEVEIV